jgi:hypothetical protein
MNYSSMIVERLILLILVTLLLGLMVSAEIPADMAGVVYATDSGVMSEALSNFP